MLFLKVSCFPTNANCRIWQTKTPRLIKLFCICCFSNKITSFSMSILCKNMIQNGHKLNDLWLIIIIPVRVYLNNMQNECIQYTLSLRAALGLPAEFVARAKVSRIQAKCLHTSCPIIARTFSFVLYSQVNSIVYIKLEDYKWLI